MRLVIKFGVTSVGSGERIRAAAEWIARVKAQGHEVVLVTSAMAKVTDALVSLAEKVLAKTDEDTWLTECYGVTRQLEKDHQWAAQLALGTPRELEEVHHALARERKDLEKLLMGSHLLGELSRMGYDALVTAGERMCIPLLAACLREVGLDAVPLGGDEAGIVTDCNYGSARPDEVATRGGVRSALLPHLDAGRVPVVAGFYGRSHRGRIAILGRGGSDYSASLLGCSLDADEIWIMTDVDGVKTGNPRLIPDAFSLPSLSYEVAAEMALLGAKVLHGKCALPAARQKIPLRIASTFAPEKPGTYLTCAHGEPEVTALTLVRQAGWVQATAPEGITEHLAVKLIQEVRRRNIDVLARASGFNGASLMYLVGNLDLPKFLRLLEKLRGDELNIEVHRDVAVLGIVGEKVTEVPGLLAKVSHSLDRVGSTPLVLLLGASPNSIVIALPDCEKQLGKVLRALHEDLGLNRLASAPPESQRCVQPAALRSDWADFQQA